LPLVDIEIPSNSSILPDEVIDFLHEADLRINEFFRSRTGHGVGFVPSDFVKVYHVLKVITEVDLSPGTSMCEWGSGFGVVASLATTLGFDVCGIEIDKDLVDAAQNLADDFGLPVEFVQGSFIPSGAEDDVEEAYANHDDGMFQLVTVVDDAYDQLERDPDDFDIIFTYPWPGEEYLIANLFEKYAAVGALLLMYNQFNSVQLQRKVAKKRRRS